MGEVATGDRPGAAAKKGSGEVSRPAGDVEHVVVGANTGELDGVAAPGCVASGAEHGVDQLVPRGNGVEHGPHARGFVRRFMRRCEEVVRPGGAVGHGGIVTEERDGRRPTKGSRGC